MSVRDCPYCGPGAQRHRKDCIYTDPRVRVRVDLLRDCACGQEKRYHRPVPPFIVNGAINSGEGEGSCMTASCYCLSFAPKESEAVAYGR